MNIDAEKFAKLLRAAAEGVMAPWGNVQYAYGCQPPSYDAAQSQAGMFNSIATVIEAIHESETTS